MHTVVGCWNRKRVFFLCFLGLLVFFSATGVSPAATTDLKVTITSPNAFHLYITQGTTVNLAGTASGPATITKVTWTNMGYSSGAASGTTKWSVSKASLRRGVNLVTVTAQDSRGRTASDTMLVVSFVIDKTAPQVTIVSPANGSFTNNPTPVLNFTAVDPESGVRSTAVLIDGKAVAVASGGKLPSLKEGAHTVKVTATNYAGLQGSAQSTFTVDTVPPSLTATPPGGPYTTTQMVALAATDASPTKIYYTLDGSAPTTASTLYSGPIPISASSTLKSLAVDAAGNPSAVRSDAYEIATNGFTWAPKNPHEGDVIGLYGDSAAGRQGVTWTWRISKTGSIAETYLGQTGFIVPAEVGAYDVELTIADNAGWSRTTKETVNVGTFAPRVNALDVEVLAGSNIALFGRFLDQGWKDSHTARWIVGSGSSPGRVEEDNLAPASSGKVEGSFAASTSGSLSGTLTVTDSDGSATSADFTVNVIADDLSRDEGSSGNNTFAKAGNSTKLHPGSAHLSYIQSAGDVDIFEVRKADGTSLPAGTEVLATLRDLPADYDLLVFQGPAASFGTSSAGFQSAGFMHSPIEGAGFMHSPIHDTGFMHSPFSDTGFMHSPLAGAGFMHSPFLDTGFMHSPFVDTGFMHSPVANAGFMHSPFNDSGFMHSPFDQIGFMHSPTPGLDGYPLSQMSYTGLQQSNVGGTDVNVAELGFDLQDLNTAGVHVAGFSANPGTDPEALLVGVGEGTRTYVAVVGHNGAYSSKPYTIQIESSTPQNVLDLTPAEQAPLVASPSMAPAVLVDNAQPLTLFVTQAGRLQALYPGNNWADLLATLTTACVSPLIEGKVISVPGAWFQNWDAWPRQPEKANLVADQIRGLIQGELQAHSSIKYIVMVGSDKVVPQYRVPDQTDIGNEKGYASSSFLKTESPLLASLTNGFVLTDDYYADSKPTSFNGRSLFLPDVAVSRLVETPGEISGAIQTFLDNGGNLSASTALVTGYSFMADGAAHVKDVLDSAGLTTQLLTDVGAPLAWSGAGLRAALNGGPGLSDVNAHFTHFGGISASGYEQSLKGPWNLDELVTGPDLVKGGSLVFSMGCHSGFNIPDEQVNIPDPAYGIKPQLDLPQAMMQNGIVYVGNTGYGYGDTEGIAGSEALIGVFAGTLRRSGVSVGEALAQAKRDYIGSLSTITPYDEKSSIEFSMFGMPQYKEVGLIPPASVARIPFVGAGSTAPSGGGSLSVAGVGSAAVLAAASLPSLPANFTLTVVDGNGPTGTTSSHALAEQVDPTGNTYLTAGGDAQATFGHPLQPRVVVPLNTNAGGPVTGILVTGGEYVDLPYFNPAISRWSTEWERSPQEFQIATQGWWPSLPAALTSNEVSPGQFEQHLVVNPGQFLAGSASGSNVTGTERVWTKLTVELIRAPVGADTTPPTVHSVNLSVVGGTVHVNVDAQDASGISRIDVLQTGNPVQAFTFAGSDLGPPAPYHLAVPLPGVDPANVSLVVQVMDVAHNITTVTAKGAASAIAFAPGADPSTRLVSTTDLPAPGNGWSGAASVSGNGRYVAFASGASNLVFDDTNVCDDIFVRDRTSGTSGTIERVSLAADGTQADGPSAMPSISADGRYVAFASAATKLTGDPAGNRWEIFVRDRMSGTTERVGVVGTGGLQQGGPSISADGRYVAYSSPDPALTGDSTGLRWDVFVRDRIGSGEVGPRTIRASVAIGGSNPNGSSGQPSIAADALGFYVAFTSAATNFSDGGDSNSADDIFLYDSAAGTTEMLSVADNGTQGTLWSSNPSISADGRYVAFVSQATNLLGYQPDNVTPVDNNGAQDIFVRDRVSATTERVSVSNVGAEADGGSEHPSISANGRYVAFSSGATNLVPGATGGGVFVRDRTGRELVQPSTQLVSVDLPAGYGPFGSLSLSGDGKVVAFEAEIPSPVSEGSYRHDLFARDLNAASTELLSVAPVAVADDYSRHPSTSADGRYTAFTSAADNLVPGDTNRFTDIFVYDRVAGTMERVSVPTPSDGGPTQGDGDSTRPSISADGRYVAFVSHATNLVSPNLNEFDDVFVHDRRTGTTEQVSVAAIAGDGANGASTDPSISADGRYVAFTSQATNLVSGGSVFGYKTFVRDRQTGATELIGSSLPVPANASYSTDPSISADGRFVAVVSQAVDNSDQYHIFVHDRLTGIADQASVATDGAKGNDSSLQPSISADGRFVTFYSSATNLVPVDTNSANDIFVHDRLLGVTERVSTGSDGVESNGYSFNPTISADGRYVAFISDATNLVPGGVDGSQDVFVYDRLTGVTERVSVATDGTPANLHSDAAAISADGRFVAFRSAATNLVPNDINNVDDIFLRFR